MEEILTDEEDQNIVENKSQLQTHKSEEYPFLDVNMSCYLEGDQWFVLYYKLGQVIMYDRKENTKKPGNLCKIPPGMI